MKKIVVALAVVIVLVIASGAPAGTYILHDPPWPLLNAPESVFVVPVDVDTNVHLRLPVEVIAESNRAIESAARERIASWESRRSWSSLPLSTISI